MWRWQPCILTRRDETFAHGRRARSRRSQGEEEEGEREGGGDEDRDRYARARAKGKGVSYFWLLSRKSNLRSLTPKELQMHGRQHTGVSIYEARTGTREKDERSVRSDARGAGGAGRGRNGRWRD